ncbi:hypothetical protein [Cypionkella psychrotolerans]|uniref:hypothetical protein n=1 Tax=Cypionkella psychrotolerans TaxID=1678131 RepID=UPI0006B449DE|nr:hypothetical protein [Cypionkella psychrotolerans]
MLRFALVLGMMVAALPLAAGELSPAQMRAYGFQLMATGDQIGAMAVAEALLGRDPHDAAALFLKAQASSTGPESRQAARLSFRATQDPETRFSAAMFIASSYAQDNRKGAAQLWLRKAADLATSPEAREVVRAQFDYVRSSNPLILQFDLSVRPSSNVNNGSTATSFRNPGIPWLPPEIEISGEQSALSGIEANFAADLTYRLPPTATTRTEFSLHLDQSQVWLSSEAHDIAPEAEAKNYATATVEAGVTRLYRPVDSKLTYRFGAFAGHDWSGGRNLANRLRLEFGGDLIVSNSLGLYLGVSGEKQTRLDATIRSSDVYSMTVAATKRLQTGDILQFSLSGRDTVTESPGLENTSIAARVVWRKAQPVAGMGLSLSASSELRDYPFSPFDLLDGRVDHRNLLAVTLDLNEFDYMGFSPSVTVTASDVSSNVDLFTTREVGVSMGFKSNF